jgi:hypothetical protein
VPLSRRFLLALPLAACAGRQSLASDRITASLLPLRGGARDLGRGIGALRYAGGLALTAAEPGFGGFSALWTADGSDLVLLSDRGLVARAKALFDDAGNLAGLGATAFHTLSDRDGNAYPRAFVDAEALARLPDGRFAIAFEQHHRIMVFDADLRREEGEIYAPDTDAFGRNEGMETLAALTDGRLVIIAEADGRGDPTGHAAWIGGADAWDPFVYRSAPGHKPVDAVQLPSGDLLVLERRQPFLASVGGRLVRVRLSDLRGGADVSGAEIARLDAPAFADNFEGVTAWQDADGLTHLFLVSDDNQTFVLRTVLVQFVLEEG